MGFRILAQAAKPSSACKKASLAARVQPTAQSGGWLFRWVCNASSIVIFASATPLPAKAFEHRGITGEKMASKAIEGAFLDHLGLQHLAFKRLLTEPPMGAKFNFAMWPLSSAPPAMAAMSAPGDAFANRIATCAIDCQIAVHLLTRGRFTVPFCAPSR